MDESGHSWKKYNEEDFVDFEQFGEMMVTGVEDLYDMGTFSDEPLMGVMDMTQIEGSQIDINSFHDFTLPDELNDRYPGYMECAAKLFYENEKQSEGNQEFQRILPAFPRLKEFADRACGGTEDLRYFDARAIGDAIRECMNLDDCVSSWEKLSPRELIGALDGMVYYYRIFPQPPLKATIFSFADRMSARKDVLDFCKETLR